MARKKAQTPMSKEAPVPTGVDRRNPTFRHDTGSRCTRFAESAGETAAECAAICCCCPCGLVNLLAVVTVRLPAVLARKTLRCRRKLRRNKGAILWTESRAFGEGDGDGFTSHGGALLAEGGGEQLWQGRSPSEEVSEVEKIMRASFYGAGFWRSPSRITEKEEECQMVASSRVNQK
ncbi:uncharacterized protein LOC122041225 [Zingiber officinale]|uniref:Uncharacterized protein n=1 Tax=Zingiber officinale TaxID=94328 RepID=A0A8J5IDM3_ZINOF|nr:uncharacterized protein LOC122041225 [Zingiber officinale]KAG6533071.1 hypothetical protein ZIOFF_006932 [Zingiber officinale]